MTRVVVVGAGLLGSAVADELATLGLDVTVLDAGQPGSGTSGSSFAWVNAQDKTPADYFELNAAGVAAWPSLARELGGSWFHPGGDVAVARGPAAARLVGKVERHRVLGYAVRELDRAAVAALEPAIAMPTDGEVAAAHFPDESWIDAPAAIDRRLARAGERGATVRPGSRVTSLNVAGTHVNGLRTGDGDLPADLVVVAAGTGSEALAATAGVVLPMAPTPGLLVTTTSIDVSLSHVVHAGDVALRPDGDDRVLLSSRDLDASLDPSTRSIDADAAPTLQLLARAVGIVPALGGATVEQVRVGVRSVAIDGIPVAGFAPGFENLYLLIAHSGVTLAPVLGRLAAAELCGRPQDRLDAYRPDRFA